MDAILDTIDSALRQKGLSDAAASKLAVGHPALIKNLRMPRDGEKRYNLPALMKLAEVLDLEFYFGPKRPPPRPVELRVISNHAPDEDAPTGFLTIPWHEGGLGSGSAPIAFSRAWLDRHQLVPDFLQAIIPDRFAIPDAPAADTVALLDTRAASREGPGLWCYQDSTRTTVAHMTFRDDLCVIHPASPDGEAQILKGMSAVAMRLIGKVVWLGQSLPYKGQVG